MNHPTKKQIASLATEALKKEYPLAECSLEYVKPHELLISVRLAAQCTDARVNLVTKELYRKYPTVKALAEANVNDVAEIIRPCGFFNVKSKDIVAIAQKLVSDFGGEVPGSPSGQVAYAPVLNVCHRHTAPRGSAHATLCRNAESVRVGHTLQGSV